MQFSNQDQIMNIDHFWRFSVILRPKDLWQMVPYGGTGRNKSMPAEDIMTMPMGDDSGHTLCCSGIYAG